MTIRRFYFENINNPSIGDSISIVGQEHKHLSSVLRCAVGDTIVLWCGDSNDYSAIIDSISKDKSTCTIKSITRNKAEINKDIVLYLGLLKNADRYEFAVQKCVELGVSKIIPFASKNTVAKNINIDRLNTIALNAIKQCGRSRMVNVEPVVNFQKVLEDITINPAVLFAYEKAVTPIKFALQSKKLASASALSVVIGSEGGFDDDEIMQVYDTTIVPVGLGNRILRTETAAISVMSLLTIGL